LPVFATVANKVLYLAPDTNLLCYAIVIIRIKMEVNGFATTLRKAELVNLITLLSVGLKKAANVGRFRPNPPLLEVSMLIGLLLCGVDR
jgi:hypothetical protein